MLLTRFIAVSLLLVPTLAPHALVAQDSNRVRFKLETFGDYFYKFGGDSVNTVTQYSSLPKERRAMQLRRVLATFSYPIAGNFTAHLGVEHNDKMLTPSGTFGFYLKTAYLEWKDIVDGITLNVGLSPTPTWSLGMSERMWGYRGVEKTVSDIRGIGTATDAGFTLRANFGSKKQLGLVGMIANGAGVKPDADKYRKYMGVANYRFLDNFVVEGYGDFEELTPSTYKWTAKGILAYDAATVTIGVEAVNQLDHCGCPPNGEKNRLSVSGYARATLFDDPTFVGFVRYDLFDPDTKITTTGIKENLLIAGLDYKPVPQVHVIPNIWITTYTDKAGVLDIDPNLVGRLTFWFTY